MCVKEKVYTKLWLISLEYRTVSNIAYQLKR